MKTLTFLPLLLSILFFGPVKGCPAPIDHAVVGIYAVDISTEEVVIDQNGDLSMIPASCLKLLTTGAALRILGSEYRFTTRLEYEGTLQEGTLAGNLRIVGGGDPTLGSGRPEGSLSWQLRIAAWADAIEAAGIRKIAGAILPDTGCWEATGAVPSWSLEDLGSWYGAGAYSLSFHENAYSVFFRGDRKPGDRTSVVRIDPPVPCLSLQNEIRTVSEGSRPADWIHGSELVSLQKMLGTIPGGPEEYSIRNAIPDPQDCCIRLLSQELEARGIAIERAAFPPGERVCFHVTSSPPLREIVKLTNQKSLNLHAELLLRKIGEAVEGEGSTAAGSRAITKFWRDLGIDLEGCRIDDGSGLSRKNLITPKILTQVLLQMKHSSLFPVFLDSLPEIDPGIRGKTGGMTGIRGVVGYKDGIAFAVLINHHAGPSVEIEQEIEKIIRRIGSESIQGNSSARES